LINVIVTILIVQFVLYLLIAFNVVGNHSGFVSQMWRGLNSLLDPVLRPIRRMMPDTGSMDFSALVLIILLKIVQIVLYNVAVAGVT
jgi:YggT family protein